jgi:hypothetical protein
MKKKFFLVIVVLLISRISRGQFDYYVPKDSSGNSVKVYNRHLFGEKNFSVSPNILTSQDIGIITAGGIKFQVFLSEKISLDADLVIGNGYLHGGPGVIAIPFWLLFFNQSGFEFDGDGGLTEFLIMVAAGILSFEHISYHIPLKNKWDISPYISLLRFRQVTLPENVDFDSARLSFATGIQMDKYLGRFFISPYADYSIGYQDHISGFNFGIGIGISFPPRK